MSIQPYPVAAITNYSRSYNYNPSLGFQFYPILSFPQCGPSYPKTSALSSIRCTLYDANMTVIVVDQCYINPNDTHLANYTVISLYFTYMGSPYQRNLSDWISIYPTYQVPGITSAFRKAIKTSEELLIDGVSCLSTNSIGYRVIPTFAIFFLLALSIGLGAKKQTVAIKPVAESRYESSDFTPYQKE